MFDLVLLLKKKNTIFYLYFILYQVVVFVRNQFSRWANANVPETLLVQTAALNTPRVLLLWRYQSVAIRLLWIVSTGQSIHIIIVLTDVGYVN